MRADIVTYLGWINFIIIYGAETGDKLLIIPISIQYLMILGNKGETFKEFELIDPWIKL